MDGGKKEKIFLYGNVLIFAVYTYLLVSFVQMKGEPVGFEQSLPLYACCFVSLITMAFMHSDAHHRFCVLFVLVHLFLGIFCLMKWYEPGPDVLLENQSWLTTMNVLYGMHFFTGIFALVRNGFRRPVKAVE